MGNVSTTMPMGYRIERVMRNFNFPMSKVKQLWAIFTTHALSSGGPYLSKDEFFKSLLMLKETCITDQMFMFIGSESDDFLSFGEFVELIVIFACFEKKELLRYLFYILDPTRTGLVAKTELRHFVHNMWEKKSFKNITDGFNYLDSIDDGDGAFNHKQLLLMDERFPMTMAPLYRLQVAIIQNTLGERWWEMHKASLSDVRIQAELLEYTQMKKKEKQQKLEKEIVSEAMLRHRMGNVKYYLLPWRREVEKARILRMVAIENSLDASAKKFSRTEIM